jgi:hypothetical protein
MANVADGTVEGVISLSTLAKLPAEKRTVVSGLTLAEMARGHVDGVR